MSDGGRVTVIGGGSWGTTLAVLAARAGRPAALWVRDPAMAATMRQTRRNPRHVPMLDLPDAVAIGADPAEAVAGAEVVIFAIPTHSMRAVAEAFRPLLPTDAVVASVAKGLERGTLRRMTEVLTEALPSVDPSAICAISGPNLATEIAQDQPAATVVAAAGHAAAERVRDALMTKRFRLYTHTDVIGVEIGGALKNVIALGAGMGVGLGASENAKAAFVTRGIAEIARLGVALGANPLTFAGLAGLGDLIATCASPLSRNRRAGQMLIEGVPLAEIGTRLGEVAEGIPTAAAARELGHRHGVDLPITEQVCAVVFEGRPPLEAIDALMGRDPRDELEGIVPGGTFGEPAGGDETGRPD
ncbi:MAG: NAD(P)-dependent glycerol-3-phosphate dehydrogenase [Thermomicrobiales bacterium]|nr:NAD(P)-dependent glycerol-3-phosphate dehydrogenase [Thermomicrobiales bacterium]